MANIEKILEVMAALRDAESGCPWDRQQTFASIAPYTVEEAYEVADAIARDNMPDLQDELGDLLFQVVFHSRMAEEAGLFDFDAVVDAISAKMVRRHPHVFGDEADRAAGINDARWEAMKAEERGKDADQSTMAGIALNLPALTRAEKLGKRASQVGFDWSTIGGVREKIHEELDELDGAVGTRVSADVEEEFGDVLFAVVNLARHLGVDPENALSGANRKFERRFRDMEAAITEQGKRVQDHNLETLDKHWRAAKKRVG